MREFERESFEKKSNDCRKAAIWFIEIRTLTLPIIHINLISSQQRLFKARSALREFESERFEINKRTPEGVLPFATRFEL